MPDLNPPTALGSPAPTGHALAAEATLDVTGADLDRLLLRREAAELTPPQALAARMDGDAARYRQQADLASRTRNVTALNYAAGRSDGALAAASEVTQVLGPKWDALQRELTEVAAHAVIAEHDRNEARNERDALSNELLAVRATLASERDQLTEVRADLSRTTADWDAEVARLRAELATCRERNAADVTRLTSTQGHRERLNREAVALNRQLLTARADLAGAQELIARWPKCPDGCGCRLGTGDPDARECGCDGPCTTECRENGHRDAMSYRDMAVGHAMDERDRLTAELADARASLAALRERDGRRAKALHQIAVDGGHLGDIARAGLEPS